MKVYTYKNCSTCRMATRWLSEKGIQFDERPIRETPPSKLELKQMLQFQNGELKRLFNVAGGDYRELKMKELLPKMDESEALKLLSGRGNLIKRPFLIGDRFGLVGFKEAEWAAEFNK